MTTNAFDTNYTDDADADPAADADAAAVAADGATADEDGGLCADYADEAEHVRSSSIAAGTHD